MILRLSLLMGMNYRWQNRVLLDVWLFPNRKVRKASSVGGPELPLKKNVWRHFLLNPYLILNVSLFNQTAHLYVYHEIYYGFCFLNCRKSFLNLNLSISVSVKGSTDYCSTWLPLPWFNQGMVPGSLFQSKPSRATIRRGWLTRSYHRSPGLRN